MAPKVKKSRPAEHKRRLRSNFSGDHPPLRRRNTYRPCTHVSNFTYEDDIKIKNKNLAGIPRPFYLSTETISRPPQSRETIPLKPLMFLPKFWSITSNTCDPDQNLI
jgi:hypothetical protein